MALSHHPSIDASPVRILVVGERVALYRELRDAAREQGAHVADVTFSNVGTSHLPVDAEPDVAVIEAREERDIVRIIHALTDRYPQTKVVLISPHDDEEWLKRVVGLGVHYCMLRPFDVTTLLRRLLQTAQPDRHREFSFQAKQRVEQTEAHVTELLSEIGMPAHYRGYAYLRVAIALAVHDESSLNRITSYLYPTVAKRFGVSPAHVERSIRHAIEVTWMRGDLQRINALFAYTIDQDKGKPTNALFIARLADHVRLDGNTVPTE